jgi:hypothetical protein
MLALLELVEEGMVDVEQYYNLKLKSSIKKESCEIYLPFKIDPVAGICVIPVTCCVVIVVVSIDELVRTVVTV